MPPRRWIGAAGLLLLAACAESKAPAIRRVAEFYVGRYADTLRSDTARRLIWAPTLSEAELESITESWTAAEWEAFWDEVEQLRRTQRESAPKADG